MLENLEEVEGSPWIGVLNARLIGGPIVGEERDWGEPMAAIRDLLQLWYWRDVRIWVSEDHLDDGRKPVQEERFRARLAAVREFSQDFFERGEFMVQADDLGEGEPIPSSRRTFWIRTARCTRIGLPRHSRLAAQ